MSIKIVIPSKGRSKTIAQYSLALFPDAVVSVDEREIADSELIQQKWGRFIDIYFW